MLLFSIVFITNAQITSAVPMTGNPNAAVTLVEYYDYECPHCRRMESVIETLQRCYPQLQIVYRPAPILSPESNSVAAFVLAAELEGQWLPLHKALMNLPSAPTSSDAVNLSEQLGLSTLTIGKISQQNTIRQQLQQNIQLASAEGNHGNIELPTLVFGQTDGTGQRIILYGEQSYALLAAIVEQLENDTNG